MNRWLTTVVVVLFVLVGAIGLRNLAMEAQASVAGTTSPVPPGFLLAGTTSPVPPGVVEGTTSPVPPGFLLAGTTSPVPPGVA